ncbi:unnamed protein product [marine sediment metagenome]|uniref:Uncharacterized protein n=1 Tax=marine sediment metagenome TaxID=412755 RepID=X1DDI8_9ZZZZ
MPTKEDVFEQMVDFTLSEQYMPVKSLIDLLVEKAKPLLDSAQAKYK